MTVRLNPYVNFRAEARDAMTFYRSIFGGELSILSFADFGMDTAPEDADKIMHSQLTGENGIEFMAADTPDSMELDGGRSTSMSLFGDDEAVMTGYFEKLAEGGTTTMALGQAPWGSKFGMCVDRFGVSWMVNIDAG